jgi:hypothetical protein
MNEKLRFSTLHVLYKKISKKNYTILKILKKNFLVPVADKSLLK